MSFREKDLEELAKRINSSKRILFFTGAGISTSAGIPDFRGSNGVWRRMEPVYYDEFVSSFQKRMEYWRYKAEMWRYLKEAKPTFSHLFIKRLADMGKVIAVVTQNIDGLHQKSGLPESLIIELHGNNSKARCLKCGKVISFDEAVSIFLKENTPPRCSCGGDVKPDVVMFGEMLDSLTLQKAFSLALKADLIISVGSSLVVQPASLVPYEGKLRGAFYVIINKGETSHDHICDIKIDMACDDVFKMIEPKIVESSHQ